jgi:hypothetical protein
MNALLGYDHMSHDAIYTYHVTSIFMNLITESFLPGRNMASKLRLFDSYNKAYKCLLLVRNMCINSIASKSDRVSRFD